MSASDPPRIAVLGAGAVGCYFGGLLARAGASVVLIGRPPVVEAIARDGLILETGGSSQRIDVEASVETAAAHGAEYVLFCVKTPDTESAARSLAPHRSPDAAVVSLQNGVDNVERIREATGIEAIPAVVYVGVEMTAPGRIKHNGRGDLVVGDAEPAFLDRIAALFSRSGVPCRVSDNVRGELWRKLVINCAYNAISALGHVHYGAIAADPGARALMRDVVDEAIAVARAAGIVLPDCDLHGEVAKLGTMMPRATSSTAQDIARGRRTEIDALNGHVARLGAKLGVPTPVNRTLATLVLLLQESRTPTARTP